MKNKLIYLLRLFILSTIILSRTISAHTQTTAVADSGYFTSFDSTKIYYETHGNGKRCFTGAWFYSEQ